MKLYNGRSMPEFILKMSLVSICIYAVIIVYKVLMILLRGDGTEELQSEMADSSLSSSFLLFSAGMISLVMSQLTFEKHMPGGKFFRTVKGGFDTYKKASAAICISKVAVVAILADFAMLLHISGIAPMRYGIAAPVTMFIFFTLAMGICNFFYMASDVSDNSLKSTFIALIVFFIAGIAVAVNEDRLGKVHLIIAAVAAVLLPVSHIMLMKNYEKKRWKN